MMAQTRGTEATAVPVPARRRGRPKQWGSLLSVRLPTTLHDEIVKEAETRNCDVADVIRERLLRNFVSQK
jgi:hypothetical protein